MNKRGFGVLQLVLVVIIVGLLGFTGWFVWHSQKNTNKTLANADRAGSSQVSTKNTSQKTQSSTSAASTSSGPNKPGPVKVTGVSIKDLQTPPYTCPRTYSVNGNISATGAGDVKYYWQIWYPGQNKIEKTDEKTVSFTNGGSKTVSQSYTVTTETAQWTGSNQNQITLYVTGPNQDKADTYSVGSC